jgi:hypothetical protein
LLKTLLETEEKAIELDPNNLALGYISGSAILQFFEALNIKISFTNSSGDMFLLLRLSNSTLDWKAHAMRSEVIEMKNSQEHRRRQYFSPLNER